MGYSGAVPPGPPVKTNAALDFYVAGDAAGASDNNPGTIALPWKTINHAIDVLNQFDEITGNFTVHIAPATVNGYTLTSIIGSHLLRAQIVFICDGAGQGGDGFTVLSSGSPAVAGSSATQVVRAAGLGVNTFRGKTIEILTGGAAGDRRTIQQHTDTTIIPVRNFSAAVAATDTFRIIGPATIIALAGGAGGLTTLCDSVAPGPMALYSYGTSEAPFVAPFTPINRQLYFINFSFTVAAASQFFRLANSSVVLYGVEFTTNPAILITDGTRLMLGCETTDIGSGYFGLIGTTYGAATQTSWSGWGLSSAGLTMAQGVWVGFIVSVTGASRGMTQFGGSLWMLGGALEGSVANDGAFAGFTSTNTGHSGQLQAVFGTGLATNIPKFPITNLNVGTGRAVVLDGTATGISCTITALIRNATLTQTGTSACIQALGNVELSILSTVTLAQAAGGQGIISSLGARTWFKGAVTVTGGAGNDLTVDNGASFKAAAFLAAAGDALNNAVTGSCIQRV